MSAEVVAIGPSSAEWEPPEGWVIGRDGNGRRESPILTCLRNMGPSPASEIAQQLGRTTGNVSTQLRQMEADGRVRRTGRTVPGGRGGPQIEFELMPEGGEPTSPESPVEAGAGPIDKRLQQMAERVGRLAADLERVEAERDDAVARADQAEQRARAAEQRRQEAERKLAAAQESGHDVDGLRARLAEAQRRTRELEEQNARLERELEDADASADLEDLRRRYEELDTALIDLVQLVGLDPDVAGYTELRAEVERLQAGGARNVVGGVEEGRAAMRQRFFEVLLAKVESGEASEDVLDRIERLVEGTGD